MRQVNRPLRKIEVGSWDCLCSSWGERVKRERRSNTGAKETFYPLHIWSSWASLELVSELETSLWAREFSNRPHTGAKEIYYHWHTWSSWARCLGSVPGHVSCSSWNLTRIEPGNNSVTRTFRHKRTKGSKRDLLLKLIEPGNNSVTRTFSGFAPGRAATISAAIVAMNSCSSPIYIMCVCECVNQWVCVCVCVYTIYIPIICTYMHNMHTYTYVIFVYIYNMQIPAISFMCRSSDSQKRPNKGAKET